VSIVRNSNERIGAIPPAKPNTECDAPPTIGNDEHFAARLGDRSVSQIVGNLEEEAGRQLIETIKGLGVDPDARKCESAKLG